MTKPCLAILLFIISLSGYCQHNLIAFKRGEKTLQTFHEGSSIAFQGKYKEWYTGTITSIRRDSFSIQPRIVHYYLMGTDTSWLPIQSFSSNDVYTLPKPGVKIDYHNGAYQVIPWAGHVHWYWVKSGWLFRTGALGYAGLNIANDLIDKEPPFSKDKLSRFAIAGGVFLFGKLLKLHYKYYWPMGKKYHLEFINLGS